MVRSLSLSAALVLGACHAWSAPQAPTPEAVAAVSGPVRVTRMDGSVTELQNAQVVGDSLIGAGTQAPHGRVAIPMTDIQSVSERRVSAGRTAGLGVGVVAGIAAAAGLAFFLVLLHIGS